MAKTTIKWSGSSKSIVEKAIGGDAGRMFFASEWHKRISKFTPRDTGQLMSNVKYVKSDSKIIIVYVSPYARRQFYGVRYNFKRTKNPLATHHWHQAAVSAGEAAIMVAIMQKYVSKR